MRAVLALVALLVAVAVVLTLASRKTSRTFEAVERVAPALSEDVPPVPFDEEEARRVAAQLDAFASTATLPRDELAEVAARCAGWAAATTPGSGAYRAAVKLRAAAGALLAAGPEPTDPERRRARRLLAEAREALASPAAQPGGPVGAIRDQLENLTTRHREELQGGGEGIP